MKRVASPAEDMVPKAKKRKVAKTIGLKKGAWTEEEDQRLRSAVAATPPNKWTDVAKLMRNRSSKSCRLRFNNQLSPDVRTGHFVQEEDDVIIYAHSKLGPQWSKIAKLLPPGRTDNGVKNRWNSSLKQKADNLCEAPPRPGEHELAPEGLSKSAEFLSRLLFLVSQGDDKMLKGFTEACAREVQSTVFRLQDLILGHIVRATRPQPKQPATAAEPIPPQQDIGFSPQMLSEEAPLSGLLRTCSAALADFPGDDCWESLEAAMHQSLLSPPPPPQQHPPPPPTWPLLATPGFRAPPYGCATEAGGDAMGAGPSWLHAAAAAAAAAADGLSPEPGRAQGAYGPPAAGACCPAAAGRQPWAELLERECSEVELTARLLDDVADKCRQAQQVCEEDLARIPMPIGAPTRAAMEQGIMDTLSGALLDGTSSFCLDPECTNL